MDQASNRHLRHRCLADMTRSRADLIAENALLRQQLIVPQAPGEATPTHHRRLFQTGPLGPMHQYWQQALLIVQPDTLLCWHPICSPLLRYKSRHKKDNRVSHPKRFASHQEDGQEKRLWGAERIRGELLKLGVRVSKRTIQKVYAPRCVVARARPGPPS